LSVTAKQERSTNGIDNLLVVGVCELRAACSMPEEEAATVEL